MNVLAMVLKFSIFITMMALHPCLILIPSTPCSCLPRGISVGEKVFIIGYDCFLPHVYVQTSM